MKKIVLAFLLISLLVSCNKKAEKSTVIDSNIAFEKYKEGFINGLWDIYPDWASSQGFHKGDSILVVNDSVFKKKQLDFAHSQLDSLQRYPIKSLSDNNIIDFHIIQNQKM